MGGIGTPEIIILLIILLIIYWVKSNNRTQKVDVLKEAYQKYQDSLNRLKSNPSNPDLKQSTLHLGRLYSELSRANKGQGGVTIYDEVALMNDINAVTAGANYFNHVSPSQPTQTIEERLSKLSDLKDKGLIDQQEYDLKRQKILDDV